MARRSSGSPFVFLLLLILLTAGFVVFLRRPGVVTPKYPEHNRSRESGHAEYGNPEGHRSERQSRERHTPAACDAFATTCQSRYLRSWTPPEDGACATTIRNGYPVPDARCTPGGVDPSVTAEILADPAWRTSCLRNCQSSVAEKHVTYGWYGIRKPKGNSGEDQVCELDHLVPLELGGADGLGNIWPECGPDSVTLDQRYFKMKDRVENYLADEVKRGHMPLDAAQRGIAENWTQYLAAANRYCAMGGRC